MFWSLSTYLAKALDAPCPEGMKLDHQFQENILNSQAVFLQRNSLHLQPLMLCLTQARKINNAYARHVPSQWQSGRRRHRLKACLPARNEYPSPACTEQVRSTVRPRYQS